jgi:hypothetical protein
MTQRDPPLRIPNPDRVPTLTLPPQRPEWEAGVRRRPRATKLLGSLSLDHFLCDERHGHRAGQPAQKAKWAISSPISSLLMPLPSARLR